MDAYLHKLESAGRAPAVEASEVAS
jgi:hypothetical protein